MKLLKSIKLKTKFIVFFILFLFAINISAAQEVDIKPNITITSPTEDQNFTNPQNINLEAKVFDGLAKKVDFKIYKDNEEIKTLEANVGGKGIWNKILDVAGYPDGNYFVSAHAVLESGKVLISEKNQFRIEIIRPLEITLINPVNNEINIQQDLQVKASIGVENIAIFLKNHLLTKSLGYAAYNQENDIWELNFDTTDIEDGYYELLIEGYGQEKYSQITLPIVIKNGNSGAAARDLPTECVVSGILSQNPCQRFIFSNEKIDCSETGVGQDFCDTAAKIPHLPDECRLKNISDIQECQKLLVFLYAPDECQEFNSLNACHNFLREKYVQPECQSVSINEKDACDDYLINKYKDAFTCEHLDINTCQRVVRERHLPELLNILDRLNNLEKELKNTSDITDSRVKILASSIKIVLNRNDELVYSPPMVMVIDTDGDGLPDATENRLGTSPLRHDTDRDGFNDFREAKENLENLREIGVALSSLDKIVFNALKLNQPKIFGDLSSLLTIKNIENKNSSFIISGQSFPESFVTIFIYSDIPLVFDIKTDEEGNFKAAIKDILPDGHHRAYAAIIDDRGEVLAKSTGYDFAVKNGRLTNQLALQKDFPENSNKLLLTAAFFGLIIIFLFFLRKKFY